MVIAINSELVAAHQNQVRLCDKLESGDPVEYAKAKQLLMELESKIVEERSSKIREISAEVMSKMPDIKAEVITNRVSNDVKSMKKAYFAKYEQLKEDRRALDEAIRNAVIEGKARRDKIQTLGDKEEFKAERKALRDEYRTFILERRKNVVDRHKATVDGQKMRLNMRLLVALTKKEAPDENDLAFVSVIHAELNNMVPPVSEKPTVVDAGKGQVVGAVDEEEEDVK